MMEINPFASVRYARMEMDHLGIHTLVIWVLDVSFASPKRLPPQTMKAS